MKNYLRQTIFLLAVFAAGVSVAPLPAQEHTGIPALSNARIAEVAAMLPEKPGGFGPPCSDRAAWKPVLTELDGSISRAAQFLSKPLPPFEDDRYLEFSRNGNRNDGEAMLQAHDGQLSALVLAECGEWQGRFLPRIAEQLDAISSQRSWTLPAHDGTLENFKGTRYFVDLGAAALGQAVAQALYMLGDKLPEASRKRAMAALELHMFAPMRESIAGRHRDFWFYATSNWNAVCWNGVTSSALTILPGRQDRALFAAAGELYSRAYLGSFTDSGYAEEGIGYWGYGFTNYEGLREHLWLSTRGKIDLYDNPKAQKAALFPFQFQMLPGVWADFADAHFMAVADARLMRRIDTIFSLGVMKPETGAKPIGGPLSDAVMAVFPVPSTRGAAVAKGYDSLVGLRTYYADAGVLVSRPGPEGKLAVTIKAGGNGGHSHNDIGSYAIGLAGTQPLGDPGGPSFYTAVTFTDKRFESKLLNSFGHPVPTVDGHLQLEATKVVAPVLTTSFTNDEDRISIDMSHAYEDSKLKRLVRTLIYSRSGSGTVTIEDRFDISAPTDIEEAFPTHGTWRRIDAGALQFDYKNAHLKVEIQGPGTFTTQTDEDAEYGQSFTRVGVRFHLTESCTVRLRLTPLP